MEIPEETFVSTKTIKERARLFENPDVINAENGNNCLLVSYYQTMLKRPVLYVRFNPIGDGYILYIFPGNFSNSCTILTKFGDFS